MLAMFACSGAMKKTPLTNKKNVMTTNPMGEVSSDLNSLSAMIRALRIRRGLLSLGLLSAHFGLGCGISVRSRAVCRSELYGGCFRAGGIGLSEDLFHRLSGGGFLFGFTGVYSACICRIRQIR